MPKKRKPTVDSYRIVGQEHRLSRGQRTGMIALAATIIGAPIAAVMWLRAKPAPHYLVALHLSDASVEMREFTERAFKRMAVRHYLGEGVRV